MPPGPWLPVYVKDEKMGLIFRGASTTCLCCFMCKLPMIMAVVTILDWGGVGKSVQSSVFSSAKILLFCCTQHVFSYYLQSLFSVYEVVRPAKNSAGGWATFHLSQGRVPF